MIDKLRTAYPHLGVAVYAYKPGPFVVLELHAPDSDPVQIHGKTVEECVLSAFPELAEDSKPETPESIFD